MKIFINMFPLIGSEEPQKTRLWGRRLLSARVMFWPLELHAQLCPGIRGSGWHAACPKLDENEMDEYQNDRNIPSLCTNLLFVYYWGIITTRLIELHTLSGLRNR